MKIKTTFAAIAAVVVLCTQIVPSQAQETSTALQFAAASAGSFSNVSQATGNAAYDTVEAEVVRIWPDRTDGIWMYQEQAILAVNDAPLANGKTRPYFQRIFRLLGTGGKTVVRENYELPNRKTYIGAYQNPTLFGELDPKSLILGGCGNQIVRVAKGYWRTTMEPCANTYKGATHMTSLSVYTPDTMVNWDRGFDASGAVVWGPPDGGYIFKRQ